MIFQFSYFLSCLFLDEESLNMELKCEHERTRQNYIEACADYHTCLKQLGIVDRLPAKIYDDMSEQLNGLPLENQVCCYSLSQYLKCEME